MLELQEGQKVLIIRYGKKPDCIEKHCDVLTDNGYCWFGKIGVVPSKKVVDAILAEEFPKIVLYSQGKGYVADVTEIAYEKPVEGYPQYYQEELFDELVFPKSYFKLISIKHLSGEELSNLTIVSSGSSAIETLNRSMSSFFFAEYGKSKTIIIDKKKRKSNKKQGIGINECYYRKNGKCTKRNFVNYEYKCERPSTCIGQKR
ncbi:MAG: hypothetical protein PUG45_12620 [bacterium]|nr:hypothetical protein [bacterium]